MQITCRICKIQQGEFFSLDSEVSLNGRGEKILEIYNKCLHLEANFQDSLPQVLCSTCFNKLKELYEFQLKAAKSDLELRENVGNIANKIKEEVGCDLKQDLPGILENEIRELDLISDDKEFIASDDDEGDEQFPEIYDLDSHKDEENVNMIDQEEEEDLEDTDIVFELYSKNDAFIERYQAENSQESFRNKEIPKTCHQNSQELNEYKEISKIYSGPLKNKGDAKNVSQNPQDIFTNEEMSKIYLQNHQELLKVKEISKFYPQVELREINSIVYKIEPIEYKNLDLVNASNNIGISTKLPEPPAIEITRLQLPVNTNNIKLVTLESLVESRKWSCSDCGRKYLTEEKLEQHRKQHSKTENCQCEVCGFLFQSIYEYREHMKTHSEERKFSCEFCDKNFTTQANLKAHLYSHTNVRPFECEVCGKKFQQKSILKTHMTLHFGKPVECTLCHRRFSRTAHLNIHMRQHNNIRPYQCPQCPSSYMQKSHLDRHISSSHLGVRYQCTICGKMYTKKPSLSTHIRGAHSDTTMQLYNCEICNLDFDKQKGLYYHLKSKHPEYKKTEI